MQSEIIAYNLVVSGWKSLPVWLDGAFKQPEAEGKPWEPGLRRCSEENPTSLPAVHISAGFRKCLSSNLPSSTSLSQSRDFEQKKMAATLASLLAVASLATAKPQVFTCTELGGNCDIL